MSFGDHIPDTGVTGERFLDRGFHVPDQNQRGVHVNFQEGCRAFIAPEALTKEDVFQFIADAAAGVAHSINTFICQGFRDHFTEQQLGDNLRVLMDAIVKARPASAKGTYIRSCVISSTMGPGIKINPVRFG